MAKGRMRSPGIDVESARDIVAAVSSIGASLHEVREHAARVGTSPVHFASGSGNHVSAVRRAIPRSVRRAVIQSALRS